MKNKKEIMYLNFTLDFNGEIEDIEQVVRGNEDVTNNVSFSDLDDFVEILKENEKFYVSEHRTEVSVWIYNDETMDVKYRYFNEPDDGEFDDYELNNIPRIYQLGV
jgi:hypothetical protein